jgi:hypothetical protein
LSEVICLKLLAMRDKTVIGGPAETVCIRIPVEGEFFEDIYFPSVRENGITGMIRSIMTSFGWLLYDVDYIGNWASQKGRKMLLIFARMERECNLDPSCERIVPASIEDCFVDTSMNPNPLSKIGNFGKWCELMNSEVKAELGIREPDFS